LQNHKQKYDSEISKLKDQNSKDLERKDKDHSLTKEKYEELLKQQKEITEKQHNSFVTDLKSRHSQEIEKQEQILSQKKVKFEKDINELKTN